MYCLSHDNSHDYGNYAVLPPVQGGEDGTIGNLVTENVVILNYCLFA